MQSFVIKPTDIATDFAFPLEQLKTNLPHNNCESIDFYLDI